MRKRAFEHAQNVQIQIILRMRKVSSGTLLSISQLAFYVNQHRAVIGPSATLTGRWRPDIDLRRMLTGLIHSVVSNYSVCGQQRPWSDYVDAQAYLGLRCPYMPEDTFSHGVAQ